MLKRILVFLFLLAPVLIWANIPGYKLEEALDDGLVEIHFKSNGSYLGDIAEGVIENISEFPMEIKTDFKSYLKGSESGYTAYVFLILPEDTYVFKDRFVLPVKGKVSFRIFGISSDIEKSDPVKGEILSIENKPRNTKAASKAYSFSSKLENDYVTRNDLTELQASVWMLENGVDSTIFGKMKSWFGYNDDQLKKIKTNAGIR